MPLQVEELIARDGSTCVCCGRELWLRDLTHRAARQLRRLDAV